MTDVSWADADHRPLSDEDVRRAVEVALAHGGRAGADLAVSFVADEYLTALHARHLSDGAPTDVITFDLGEDGVGPAGELYVSVERAERVARRRGVPVERELTLYVVHGVLHLCGFEDRTPDQTSLMRAAEREVLEHLGFEADELPHEDGID